VTLPFRRSSRKPPRFDGDFPDGDQDITETLDQIIPEWDGRTITFGGASGELPPDTEPFAAPRQPRLRRVPVGPPPAPAAAPAIPALESWADPRHDIIGRDLLHGWPHLDEIRCTYPAASHPTPIPCGTVHRDPAAGTTRDLHQSAFAAGWQFDAFGQWACPRCQDSNGQYRAIYPLTHWHPDAAPARLAEDYHAEFRLGVMAERAVLQRTREAAIHGRHHRAGA
jgi:hypothetical protein